MMDRNETGRAVGEGRAGVQVVSQGIGKYLPALWDRNNPELRSLRETLWEREPQQLQVRVADHLGKPSVGLVGRSARDKKEYVSAKVNEAYLSGITLGMEAWGERLKVLAAESEAVALLVREMLSDCAASPEFWKARVGADFTLHSRGTLVRLQVEREDQPGTWDKMEARAMDQPMLSPCGAREREEARKLVLKEAKEKWKS